ncbi:MAG TPA: C39 family peptidase, partial [Labilithrix sp.]
LWNDVVVSVDQGYAVVANIVAPPNNHPPGYPNTTIFHYIALVGYNPDTWQIYVADPANFGGNQKYWLSFDQLATLIPPKGYSSLPGGTTCPNGSGSTVGAIDAKYRALGGCTSVLGIPLTGELGAPDGVGRYNVFANGSIYWTPATNAHEVHGRIRDAWKAAGWEAGALGYPTSDEYDAPGGKKSDFQHGSITWTASSDATQVTMK